jgi:polysaccharide biosynthesis transport protein
MAEPRELSPYRLERETVAHRVESGAPTLYASPVYAGDGIGGGLTDPRNYWVIFFKHRLLILVVTALVLAITAYRIRIAPTTYIASTQIRIDPMGPQYLNLKELVVPIVDSSYYETEYAVLQSSSLAERVIRALKLYAEPHFVTPPKPEGWMTDATEWIKAQAREVRDTVRTALNATVPEPATENIAPMAEEPKPEVMQRLVARYLAALNVAPASTPRLVKVSFTSTSPKLAADVAAAHAREFIQATYETRNSLNIEAQRFLEDRLGDVKKRMEQSEEKLNEFRREHRVLAVGGNEKENVVLERLGTLNSSYASVQAERIALEAEYNLVKKRQYDSLASVQRDPTYNTLKEQLEQLRSEYGRLAQIYKPQYPKMVQLDGQIFALEGRLRALVQKAVAGVESQYLGAKAKEEALAAEVENKRKETLDLNDLNVDYQVLSREADANRDLYKKLLSRLKEASVMTNVQTSNVSVVDPAEVPSSIVVFDLWRRLGVGVVMGLVLGFGMAFAWELFDRTLKTPEDTEAALQLPSLAVIPSFSYEKKLAYTGRPRLAAPRGKNGRKAEAGASELITARSPSSVIAEAYRTLRTAVLLSSPDNKPQLIQVVSAQSREGKTVTAVNVTLTLAQSGGRVVLIDGDLRRPRCNRIFDVPNTPGLVDYLVGLASLEKCVRPLDLRGRLHGVPLGRTNGNGDDPMAAGGILMASGSVDLLPAGTKAPNPAEILGSRRMRELLASLREHYDYVIIDSPPLLPVADSVILSTLVDGVVVVVKGQATPTNLVKQGLSRLDRVGARVLGTVLNNVDVTSGDYYYYKGYYASYGYLDQSDESA